MRKKSFCAIFLFILISQPVYAKEVSGISIKSKEYAALVEELAKCKGFFMAVANGRAFELQFEIDEEEFSDEKLNDAAVLISSADRRMLEVEQSLPQKHRNYLGQKRKANGFGFGFASTIPVSMLAGYLRDCVNKAELAMK
jgi:hypothetical protein